MPRLTLIHIAALASIFIFTGRMSYTEVFPIYYCFAMSHYFVGFVYSKDNFLRAARDTRHVLHLALFGGAVYFMTVKQYPPIVLLFGWHHVLTEVYIIRDFYPELGKDKRVMILRFLLNICTYSFWFRARVFDPYTDPQKFLQYSLAAYILGIFFFILLIVYVARMRSEGIQARDKRDLFLLEALNLLVITSAWQILYDFNFIVFYHGLIWFYLYSYKTHVRGRGFGKFMLYNVLVLAIAAGSVYWTRQGTRFNYEWMASMIIIVGYVHILSSWAVSYYNPRVIYKWFLPEPPLR